MVSINTRSPTSSSLPRAAELGEPGEIVKKKPVAQSSPNVVKDGFRDAQKSLVDLEGSQNPGGTSSLLTEDSHDSQVNCLDKAADWLEGLPRELRSRTELVFLKDNRPGAEGLSGHVVVRQANSIFDPTTGKSYKSIEEYTKQKPYYEAKGAILGPVASKIFSSKPGSAERAEVLKKVPADLQKMMVADQTSDKSGQTQSAPKYSQAQADADAKALYDATDGGLTGWGTDEDKVFKTLEGKSPQEINQIRESYKLHYGKDLDSKLKDEMSGKDLERVKSLLKGKENQAEIDAVKINSEIEATFNTDESAILNTLEKATPEHRHKIAEEYSKKYGGPAGKTPEEFLLSKLDKSFNSGEMDRARKLLAVSSAKTPEEKKRLEAEAAAGKLKDACDGMGTDEDAIKEVLTGKSKQEIADIEKAYKEKYGESLRSRLSDETSGAERDVILRLLNPADEADTAGKADASAERLKLAVDGMGTDESAIEKELEGKSKAELDAIQSAYKGKYGKDLKKVLSDEASSDGERDKWLRMLNPPAQGDAKANAEATAERIRAAVEGAGTDEDALRAELGDKTKAEIDQIAAAYKQKYGEDLRKRLDSELGGRDKVEILDQMFDKGAIEQKDPNAERERIKRIKEQQAAEKGIGLSVTSWMQETVKGESDQSRLEKNLDEAEKAIDSGNKDRAARLSGFAKGDLESEQAAKDSLAEYAADGAAVIASTAVVLGTAGTATPLVAAGWAGLAGAGSAAVTYAAIEGGAADSADIARQGALGFASGATAVVGGGAGLSAAGKQLAKEGAKEVLEQGAKTALKEGAKEILEQGTKEVVEQGAKTIIKEGAEAAVEQGAKSTTKRSFLNIAKDGAIDGLKQGAAGGAAYSATDTATQRETWQDGILNGLGEVAASGVKGGAFGAVTGAAGGAVMAPVLDVAGKGLKKIVKPREIEVTPNPNLEGKTTQVRYDKGRVFIEHGPLATAADIQAHLETAQVLQKFEGPLGKIRQLKSKIEQVTQGRPGYGTQGFESQLEVKKLSGIRADLEASAAKMEAKIAKMGGKTDAVTIAEREAIEKELASIESQIANHEAQVSSLEAGRGFVAALDESAGQQQAELKRIAEALNSCDDEASIASSLAGDPESRNIVRNEALEQIRDVHGGQVPKYGGYVLDSVLKENQSAINSAKKILAGIEPDAVLGMERGGQFLAEVVTHGDAKLAERVVTIPKSAPAGKFKFDAEAIKSQLETQIAQGKKKFVLVDAYMGGTTSRALRDGIFKPLANKYPDVTFDVVWIRETFGFEKSFEAGIVVPAMQGGMKPNSPLAARIRQHEIPVRIVLGDDMDIVLDKTSKDSLKIFNDKGEITKTIEAGENDTTRSIMVRLMNGE